MGELVYQALMQSVAAFFFAVMILPAVVIFLGYLIYIVVMCIRELKKKYKGAKKHSACGSFPCAVLILRCRAAAVRNVCFCPDTSAAPPF